MINHSTLDCHVTFSTRSLAGPKRRFETLTGTLLSDSDPNPNPNHIPNKSTCWNPNPNEKFDQLPYTVISRDRYSYTPICHGGDSESASKNALIEVIFQLSGALLEKSRRSTVECLSTFVQNQIVCSSISVWKYIEWSHFHKLHRACSEDCLKIWAGDLVGANGQMSS